MPIYQYKCDDCGEDHQKLQKFNQPAPACPKCESNKQTKQVATNTSFCLMGHGWFKNGMSVTGHK